MSTIQDVINFIRIAVKDEEKAGETPRYSDDLFLLYLNAFGRDIADLSKDKTKESAIPLVSDQREYDFPTGAWYPVHAYLNTNNQSLPLTIERETNLSQTDIFGLLQKGIPRLLYIMGKKINVYPIPDNNINSFTLISIRKFTKITSADLGEDFSDHFDSEYEDYSLDYVAMRILRNTTDKQADIFRRNFYGNPDKGIIDPNAHWEKIKRIESKKFEFNTKTRRISHARIPVVRDYGI